MTDAAALAPTSRHTTRGLDRLVNFSDATVAIAIRNRVRRRSGQDR